MCLSHQRSNSLFQSTPSQRGRHAKASANTKPKRFQSTPSQRGRRFGEDDDYDYYDISIHALAKKATDYVELSKTEAIFQSTPSQRGRPFTALVTSCALRFQSTPSQRGRLSLKTRTNTTLMISIHALAKRATTTLA